MFVSSLNRSDQNRLISDSKVSPTDANVYQVKYGTFDGNQGIFTIATVRVTPNCIQKGPIVKKNVGGFDGGF